jgi:hypothetical protein
MAFHFHTLSKWQNMLFPLGTQTSPEKLGSRFRENDFPMRSDVVGMCVADENFFISGFRLMRIEPKPKIGQEYSAAMETEAKGWHRKRM